MSEKATIGSLPVSWSLILLHDLGTWQGGGTPSKSNPVYWTNGSIPWISPKDMKTVVITDSADHITPEAVASSATRLLPANSVVVVTRSGILQHTLPVAVTKVAATLNQDLKGLVPCGGIDSTYVALALQRFEEEILRVASKNGTTVQSIEFPKLLEFPIPLPPLAEQHRIVAAIETQLTRLDAAVAALQRARANLKRYRSAVLKAACEGRLVPTEAELVQAEQDNAPKEWRQVCLDHVLLEPLANGRSVPDAHHGFPVLRLTCLHRGRIDLSERKIGAWSEEEASRFLVAKGDFLVARGNGSLTRVGRGGLIDTEPDKVAYPDTLIRVRIDQQMVDPRFLAAAWESDLIRNQIERTARTTAGIYKINQQDLKRVVIPVPPLTEQHRIVAEVEQRLSVIVELERTVEHSLQRAERLRQAILKRAFAGQLVPQDPDDEPASVLLERIRAERAAKTDGKVKGRPRRRSAPTAAMLPLFDQVDR